MGRRARRTWDAAFFRGVVYEDGVKVDWTLWPANVPELIAEHGLNHNLDVGYRVLLDKDGATARWPQPTFRAHIPAKPTEEEYAALVEEFWWSATYVAKAQARGELFFARFVLDEELTYDCLRTMLEWRIELDRDWNWKPGAYGRGIERELPKEIADELEAAHDSVERTIALFRRVAREVGERLGYATRACGRVSLRVLREARTERNRLTHNPSRSPGVSTSATSAGSTSTSTTSRSA